MNKIFITSLILFLIINSFVFSNNIQITNIAFAEKDATTHSCKIRFNISWENSWRTSTVAMNWDAAWVFIKFRTGYNQPWQHATLSPNSSDHYAVTGSTIDAVSDGKGVFIYRSTNGTGNNYFNGIKLVWYYGQDGVLDNDSIQVRVLGIEMVYVPQGSFFAGDNNTSKASFIQGSNDYDPWYIGSDYEIIVTNGTGSGTGSGQTNPEYYYQAYDLYGEDSTGTSFLISDVFPKGFTAFYCMKYEISMGQYTGFLNMLTRPQQSSRVFTNLTGSNVTNYYVMTNTTAENGGNTITCPQTNNGTTIPVKFSTTTPERACNYLSWLDLTALLDWSGLRPMTELEYEKACRGTLSAISGEHAWGSTQIFTSDYIITNDGSENENISNLGFATGNALDLDTKGSYNRPFRCGIFSASCYNNSRKETGSTYYGIMEMSGNIKEQTITVGNSNGRAFSGNHGDGILDEIGDANVTSWPIMDNPGHGHRGGSLNVTASELYTSERSSAIYTVMGFSIDVGGRGVRTAP